jgi:hypothetical protein
MNTNIIWENKGIIIGIIKYFIKYNDDLKNKKIILSNNKFKYIMETLFYDIIFKKKR